MDNAKIVANFLLAAVALSTAHHPAVPVAQPTSTTTLLASEGHQRIVTRTAKKKAMSNRAPTYTVTATAYQAVAGQTDEEPFITADNSLIKPHYSSKTRWMALSNDLLAHWGGKFNYGDRVRISGISPKLDGVYTVHDTMNRRHRHCIDILTHASEKMDIFTKNVKIQLVAPGRTSITAALARRGRVQPMVAARSSQRGPRRPLASRTLRRALLASDRRGNYFASAIL